MINEIDSAKHDTNGISPPFAKDDHDVMDGNDTAKESEIQMSTIKSSVSHSTLSTEDSDEINSENSDKEDVAYDEETSSSVKPRTVESKREMIAFAIPALGIFLTAPLLSNIDNVLVGLTVGTEGLAALSPATICTDQMLYLFSFLPRATTGLISRAYGSTDKEKDKIQAVREAALMPLTFAVGAGVSISLFYFLFTPAMLAKLNVDPILRPASASYIYLRGSIAWAALAQSACLSILLSTNDAKTPLKIIRLAAVVNIIAGCLFCIYPWRWGCSGAAVATAIATLFSSGKMLQVLKKKELLPKLAIPAFSDLKQLLEYAGPLSIITIVRLIAFVSMQKQSMTFGTEPLAAYQICLNTLLFFWLFGEPFSQLHQTKLPASLDANDKHSTFKIVKNVMTLSLCTALVMGSLTMVTLSFGSGIFTKDSEVQAIVIKTAPSVALGVFQGMITTSMDGAMFASKDFSFVFFAGIFTCVVQLAMLVYCTSLTEVYMAFILRQFLYAFGICIRVLTGGGILGQVLMKGDERHILISAEAPHELEIPTGIVDGAEIASAHVSSEDFDMRMFDDMATGDKNIVGAS